MVKKRTEKAVYELCPEVDKIVKELTKKVDQFSFIDPTEVVGLKMTTDNSKFQAKISKISIIG